jgi:hypothetical protein
MCRSPGIPAVLMPTRGDRYFVLAGPDYREHSYEFSQWDRFNRVFSGAVRHAHGCSGTGFIEISGLEGPVVAPEHEPARQAVKFDPNKPSGPGQEAPLTPEYQKVLEESMVDQAKGGIGNYLTALCVPGGMPRVMHPGSPPQSHHWRRTASRLPSWGRTISRRRSPAPAC